MGNFIVKCRHYQWNSLGVFTEYVTQFVKVPDTDSTTYGVKYDYQSVMHYAKDAFASKPGKTTMETLDKQFQALLANFYIFYCINNI
jgi:hypothetical protein